MKTLANPAAALVLGLILNTACIGTASLEDRLTPELLAACDYRFPGGAPVATKPEETRRHTLRPECQAELEKVLKFDEESWKKAPPALREKVLEAFQVLIAYPLKFPRENRILGTDPYAIPVANICIIDPLRCPGTFQPEDGSSEDLNRNVFNFVVNNIDRIVYDGSDEAWGGSAVAMWAGVPCVMPRTLTIYDRFWNDSMDRAAFRSPFARAGTLVHEARHGSGNFHIGCRYGESANCDPDLSGPYGIQAAYLTMLIHGGYDVQEEGRPILSDGDIKVIGEWICDRVKEHVKVLPPGLAELLDKNACGRFATYGWIMEREGLKR